MAKSPREEGASELPGSSVPPPSGVTEREGSWRVPSDGRASAVIIATTDAPPWADAASAAARLRAELSTAPDALGAAAAIVRVVAPLFPNRAIAARLGVDTVAIASSRPLGKDERLDRTLAVAKSALERREPFGGPSEVFGEGADGFSIPLAVGGELVGAVALEVVGEGGASSIQEGSAAALVLGAAAAGLRTASDASLYRHLAWMVQQSPFPAAMVDRDYVIRAVNDLTARALGRPTEQLVGVAAPLLAARSKAAQAALEKLQRGEVVAGIELERASPHQRIVWIAVPLHDPGGAFVGAIAFGDDRSAVQILEEQILHAEKLATVGQLTAGIVHELNNPLTSISVYGDYLLQKAERAQGDAADVERLRRIVEASTRMLRFTRDLVSYARPSSEEPIELSLGEIIGQSIGFVEHVLTSASVRVVLDISADLPPVRAVRGQLHQVFVNLLTNATQAVAQSGRPSGAIRITATREGPTVRVRIADDGPGITAENLDRIFEPFFTTKEAGRGTGLGLSIVRNIIQLHGGTIAVESAHAETGATTTGTTFALSFPVRRE